jgi:hypothetical protein
MPDREVKKRNVYFQKKAKERKEVEDRHSAERTKGRVMRRVMHECCGKCNA